MIQLTTSQHYTADCIDLRAGKRSHSTSSSRTGRDLARPLSTEAAPGGKNIVLRIFPVFDKFFLLLPGPGPEWIIFHLSLLRSLMRTLMDYSSRGWRGLIKHQFWIRSGKGRLQSHSSCWRNYRGCKTWRENKKLQHFCGWIFRESCDLSPLNY